MTRKVLAVSLIFMGLFMFGACTQNVNLTNDAKYLTALSWYNDNLRTYLNTYATMSPSTQAEWKVKIDPLFRLANDALTTWKRALGTGSVYEKEQTWLEARRQLMGALITYGIIEIKEDK